MLLLVNGPPGVGKSTLARRWADDHPHCLVVEVDDLRTRLGSWSSDESTRQLARELAVDLITGHLRRGHDVVVPQYLGRPEFRDRLRALADTLDARFVEVVLLAPLDEVEARFRARRNAVAAAEHPESDVPDDAIATSIHDATQRLGADTATVRVVDASGDPDATYDELVRAIDVAP